MSEHTQTKRADRDVRVLADMLLELDDLLVSCMRCGFCMAVCPVYGSTMLEADATRGKIALLENLARRMLDDAEAVNEKLNRCLLCGSCQANCPSGVQIMDIFLRARAVVTGYMGLSPVKKLIFRGLLTRPGLFNALLDISGKFQGLFLKDANKVLGTSCAPMLSRLIGDRHFPRLAEAFHTKVAEMDTTAGKSGLRVAFFPGCASDKLFPEVPEAVLKVLKHHGVGVFMPSGQFCCGMPALASGDKKTYDALLRHNLALFGKGDFDYLVTPCATCTATIKEFWPKLTEDYSAAERRQIKELGAKCKDVVEFVVDVLKAPLPLPAPGARRVTYHDSCHMKKSLGLAEQPRAVLRCLPGFEFVEMPESDRCCGSGGSFTLQHYDLSKHIGQRKRDNVVSVKPDLVATTCPACMLQLTDMLSRNGDTAPVKHVISLYADML
ncbi:(Fe-S)-binding protein [Desulfovibrio sp. OttesenSCG-928-F20]|nr:(Fe-S)-binding protein [Desulfovibrio sp. OttesenSCG-928-F20]